MAGAGLAVAPSVKNYIPSPAPAGFSLKILATNWGFKGSMDQYLALVKKENYDGIEIWWPNNEKDQQELFSLLDKYQLEAGFLAAGNESDFNTHLQSFKKNTEAAAMNKTRKPLYVNCHSGRDYFSFEQNRQLIAHTIDLTQKTGIKICHETHRSRMLYSAPAARQFFEKEKALRITLDISHWFTVSESLLRDQQSTVEMAIGRADHIHARIGHSEGPQVNDPRAPEWAEAVKAHLEIWDKIVEVKKKNNDSLTILTEFGPPDYMPVLPYTRQPVADQWTVNVYMKDLLRKRYS
ncbi:MAG: sugar phosphate isomerase/epimerase [Gemmatimonadaceae bacterium]|nr:sugar phosphate isomerase/epimerase [Chitinophagaceae bacterium]